MEQQLKTSPTMSECFLKKGFLHFNRTNPGGTLCADGVLTIFYSFIPI